MSGLQRYQCPKDKEKDMWPGSFKAVMLATAGIQQLLQILIAVVLLLTPAVHCEGDSGRKYAVFQEVESKESPVLK
jgi:hypothetical protein